jgi:hypothetical protein
MDPISVIILGLIYAALRAPGEAGRAVRQDYRSRRGRWNSRAENWMGGRGQGRGRGGRRVAGYDRDGRPYTDRGQRGRGGRNSPPRAERGWWRDDRAWRGPEGRARIARGVRPSAIRAGIITGALAYSAVVGGGVAAAGFWRGLRGGYRMGKLHYRGKNAERDLDPTITVEAGTPGGPADPNAETVQGEVVDGEVIDAEATDVQQPDAPAPREALAAAPEPVNAADDDGSKAPAGWQVIVFAVGSGARVGQTTFTDPRVVDGHLAVIADTPGLRAEVRELTDLPEDSRPSPAGSITDPLTKEQTVTDSSNANPSPGPVAVVASYVPVGGAPVFASQLLEGANYDAHRYNLGFLLLQAQREYASGELTLAAATATRQRAEYDMAAAEQMSANLTVQDFGVEHVHYMTDLGETLAAQVFAARDAENAARDALATNEHIIEVCVTAEAAFRRDHGQLAEAHANAPHAAKTREAYQN